MKTLFSKVNVEITTDDITHLNELIKRDNAMAVIDDDGKWYKCPKCIKLAGKYEDKETIFCRYCGQRLDPSHNTFE